MNDLDERIKQYCKQNGVEVEGCADPNIMLSYNKKQGWHYFWNIPDLEPPTMSMLRKLKIKKKKKINYDKLIKEICKRANIAIEEYMVDE